jgi:hypothetical protein
VTVASVSVTLLAHAAASADTSTDPESGTAGAEDDGSTVMD